MGRRRAVQGRNKERNGSRSFIGVGFMVSLSMLRCGSGIIKWLREIRPLGHLNVWDKLACKDRTDWPDGSEGPDWMGRR